MTMTRAIFLSLCFASAIVVAGCDGGGGVPDGGLVQPDGARLCTGGETLCDATCVDTTRDTDHCGACGNVCGTAEACLDGACTLVCPDGQAVCEEGCADTSTDEANCGACGTTCAVGETCVDGACSLVCPGDQTDCGGACASTDSDPANCGACGNACAAGEVCDMGSCALSCSFGLTECEGACVDLDNSGDNCGACGFTCEAPDGALGLCASRRCRTVCDGDFADCNADLGDATGDGCEIDTAIDPDNCGACGIVCEADNAVTGCAGGACTVAMCDAGFDDCDGDFSNGCELPVSDDDMNCGACGNVCPAGEGCNSGTCTTPVAEDCSSVVALSMGPNLVDWFASNNDYLTSAPSCTSTSRAGPDLVFSYTATMDEAIELVFDKPASTRWVSVVSTAACGTVTPEEVCISDFSPTTMSGLFNLSAGETAYIYLADTTSGSNPLDDPLTVTINSTACATAPAPSITSLTPMNGATDASYFGQELEVVFDDAINETMGVVTLTASGGGTITFDLATSPDVSFDSTSTTLTIDTTTQLTPGETYTVSWSGIQALVCAVPVPSPTWSFTTALSSCGGTSACGDTCANPIALATGSNTVRWFATTNDYLTTAPSCTPSFASPDGPDLVLTYTASATEIVDISFDKPSSTRWAASVSTAACGTTAPEISCVSEFTPLTLDLPSFTLSAGETAYIYVIDTSSGSNPLDNPLIANVTTTPCSGTPSPVITMRSPAPGSTAGSLAPSIEVTFDSAVSENVGTISVSGSLGSTASYDLSMAPPEVSFNAASTVMTIDPIPFMAGESVTVSISGMTSEVCAAPVAADMWSFSVAAPSCAPGMGGVVGTTQTAIPTTSTLTSEYYVVPDESPTGFVYFGGTSDLFRVPKAGGPLEDIEAAAGLTSSQLGYELIIAGNEIFTIDSTTTGTTGRVFRISTDGGMTWSVEDYVTFSAAPDDDFRAAAVYMGRLYMVTQETTTGTDTQIWSAPLGGVAPVTGTLEVSFPEEDCAGIARDATNYYVACADGDRIVRVPVGGGAPVLITTAVDLISTKSAIFGEDLDMDGTYDVLYAKGWYEESYFICDPAGASPFTSLHFDFGGASSNYGMGFDASSGTLWVYDDDTNEIISIQ